MSIVFRLVKEVDGKATKFKTFSKNEIDLIMGGIYYAKVKDYHGPRKRAYDLVYSKIYMVVNGAIE